MDDLISRQAAIKAIRLCENHDMEHDFEFNEGLIIAMNAVKELPTAEPRKVKWVLMSDCTGKYYACSWCGHEGYPGMKHCPTCGERMTEESE